MKTGYYIISTNIKNGHDVHDALLEYGIFLNKERCQAIIDDLHSNIKRRYEKNIKLKEQDIANRIKRWDILNQHGLTTGSRPVMVEYKGWEPGRYNEEYYQIEEIDINE
jgi:hypothetical protein